MRAQPFADFARHDPFRTPDWRWRRALALVERGRHYGPVRDEPLIGLIMTFIRGLRGGRSRESIQRTVPDLAIAHRMYGMQSALRTEVEARLLNRQEDLEIGQHTELPPAVIATYEAVFFNVRDRLDCRDWIVSRAIGTGRRLVSPDDALATAVRRIGYFGDRPLLERALRFLKTGIEGLRQPGDLSTSAGRADEDLKLFLSLEALAGASRQPVDVVTLSRMAAVFGKPALPEPWEVDAESLLEREDHSEFEPALSHISYHSRGSAGEGFQEGEDFSRHAAAEVKAAKFLL